MLHSFLKAAKLKRWMAQPDCPTVLQECKAIFDKVYASKASDTDLDSHEVPSIILKGDESFSGAIPSDLRSQLLKQSNLSALRARLRHNGIIYTSSQTHGGNSLILFHPGGAKSSSAVPGSIKYIYTDDKGLALAVQRQLPTAPSTPDPFFDLPLFPGKSVFFQADIVFRKS